MYLGIWRYKFIRQKINPIQYYSSFVNIINPVKILSNSFYCQEILILKISRLAESYIFSYVNRIMMLSDLIISCQREIKMQDVVVAYTSIGFELSKFILKFRKYISNNYYNDICISFKFYEDEVIRGTTIGLQEGLNQDENIPMIQF